MCKRILMPMLLVLSLLYYSMPEFSFAGSIDFGEYEAELTTFWSILGGNPDASVFNAITYSGSPGTYGNVYGGEYGNPVLLGPSFCMLSFLQVMGVSAFGNFTLGLNFLFSYNDGYQDSFTLKIEHLAGLDYITFDPHTFSQYYSIRDSGNYLQMIGFSDSGIPHDWSYPDLYEHPFPNTTGTGVLGNLYAKPVVVPEPSSMLFMLAGLIGVRRFVKSK